uniref:BCL2 associated X, apoptosis regulator n=1 Tax=Sarcophilus harrisii TaxID=9305 RepID=A0A7N4PU30_SARHA
MRGSAGEAVLRRHVRGLLTQAGVSRDGGGAAPGSPRHVTGRRAGRGKGLFSASRARPARGGGGGGGGPAMDGSGEQPRAGGDPAATSSEQIMRTGAVLLQGFIQDRAGRVAGGAPELVLESMGDSTPLPSDPRTKRLTECLRRIGDELDSNMELQRMIAAVETDSPREVFFRVAAEMFSDGNFNWGRVVALFYFASKLVLKVGGAGAGRRGRTFPGASPSRRGLREGAGASLPSGTEGLPAEGGGEGGTGKGGGLFSRWGWTFPAPGSPQGGCTPDLLSSPPPPGALHQGTRADPNHHGLDP